MSKLSAATSYTFTVRARTAGNTSAASAPVTATTGACTSYQGGSYTAAGVSSPAAGTWLLRASDTRSWNFGSLNGWSITL
ncbi:proprotein convertase P-domain-containing protein [Catellatospora coxensis]|uniref:Fibronectin type-III domain-containing protein n=1 Tax=Catellatospora coxensis TaxID=310354 RepID=A0A8J3L1N2_9ACTN|nr:proprotein convertase P-domain-containing protein [Catellatospora coxensis]GIG07404.1 hypothetical protein Cco03nite_41040 [Catellatospora coxensis]